MTPKDALEKLLPPRARVVFYSLYALVGVALGGIQVGYGAAEIATPVWLTVALAVFAFLGTAFGAVAVANINVTGENVIDEE